MTGRGRRGGLINSQLLSFIKVTMLGLEKGRVFPSPQANNGADIPRVDGVLPHIL